MNILNWPAARRHRLADVVGRRVCNNLSVLQTTWYILQNN